MYTQETHDNSFGEQDIMSHPVCVPEYEMSDADFSDEEDIRGPRFGTTQNPMTQPDYFPYHYSGNIAGLDEVQHYVDMANEAARECGVAIHSP